MKQLSNALNSLFTPASGACEPSLPSATGERTMIDINDAHRDNAAIAKVAAKTTLRPEQRNARTKVLRGAKAQGAVQSGAELAQDAAETFVREQPQLLLLASRAHTYNTDMRNIGVKREVRVEFLGVLNSYDAEAHASFLELLALSAAHDAAPSKKAPRAGEAPRAKPAAPKKGGLSEAMKDELVACAVNGPSEGKVASCARMHLKMRGLLSDAKAGQLSPEGQAVIERIRSGQPV